MIAYTYVLSRRKALKLTKSMQKYMYSRNLLLRLSEQFEIVLCWFFCPFSLGLNKLSQVLKETNACEEGTV